MISRLFPDRTTAHTQPTIKQLTEERDKARVDADWFRGRCVIWEYKHELAQERITQLMRDLAQCQNQLAMSPRDRE